MDAPKRIWLAHDGTVMRSSERGCPAYIRLSDEERDALEAGEKWIGYAEDERFCLTGVHDEELNAHLATLRRMLEGET